MTEAPGDQRDRSTHAQLIGCAGCGGVVLSILTLLALTVFRSEQVFFDDPAQVTAALQAIVPSELPRGYRPYRGARAGQQRLVQVVPESYRGDKVPLSSDLMIAAWSFPPGTSATDAGRQALDYWTELVAKELGKLAAAKPKDQQVTLPLRGGTVRATQRELPGAGVPLRLIVVVTARAPGDPEPVALSFLGAAPRFDRPALLEFLGSIR